MKIARCSVDGQVRYGIVNGEELSEIRGSIYKKFKSEFNYLLLAKTIWILLLGYLQKLFYVDKQKI